MSGEPSKIIEKGKNSVTVATIDGKALRMNNLQLYKFPFLTGFVIDRISI